ncbi:E3 ubiquitin-protein ligase RNF169-like [Oenanthe melanoleuca]|uniref:E3 ubiquitin-protein ligase RNF169-like n=1 Tax=Oenanthe melanoleuca TaxID=2939378 RepID=UPI0024C18E7A|nr:E3 ubiquitin-protein ligase RNF169-like [Oenanthe melanoleuca]
MTAEMGGNCAICQDSCDDVASALPCGHKFCRGCILHWAQTNPSCPLCRGAIETVRFSDDAGDYLEIVITAPEQLPAATSQAGRTVQDENSPHPPVLPHPSSPQETPSRAVGGVLPEVWARLFRRQRELLDPVRTWLSQRVEAIQRDEWWMARSTQSAILYALCVYGPDQDNLIRSLQDVLEEHTVPLVQDIIDIIVRHCSSGAQRLLHSQAAADEDDSPAASSSSSSSSSIFSTFSMFSSFSIPNNPNNANNLNSSSPNSSSSPGPNSPSSSFSSSWTRALASSPEVSVEEEEEAATTDATPARGQSHPPAVPVSPEQDQPQEEAGPSVQSTRPSGLTQGTCFSPGRPQQSLKRKAPDPKDSPPPCKRSPQE